MDITTPEIVAKFIIYEILRLKCNIIQLKVCHLKIAECKARGGSPRKWVVIPMKLL